MASPVTASRSRRPAMFAGIAVFLGLWEAAARTGLIPAILVPPPSSVVAAFQKEAGSGMWLTYVVASLGHYSAGVLIGSVLGITLGVASALWPLVEASQEGIARLLRPIPPIAWIPFAIIWFGVTEGAAAFIIAIGVFWLNYFAANTAVKGVDRGLIELAHAFGQGSLVKRLLKVVLPGAAPGLFSGLRAGLGMGWIAVLAAELFGISGIGQRMMEASGVLATDIVLLYMATIALLYAIFDGAVIWVAERTLRWTH
ncbi:ABC transporter permease [Paramagnetospirillum magneticum]|uniref:ABC-type nitrate/sulfonate/bicarbonate transport system n=1 Tax=Paramagnetospirillum magneticum (strain ATCC 700264 / AMB-1) TaxID=342108 RepID=Q2W657_PARM1|nr:ABC transporter permease [Paramagnetospirillum magneticum]BAE50668.1 ABC-type nitrate/sulfonate/bicarbonate transport system [Paramagnetospirillum magneticum AMB-1]